MTHHDGSDDNDWPLGYRGPRDHGSIVAMYGMGIPAESPRVPDITTPPGPWLPVDQPDSLTGALTVAWVRGALHRILQKLGAKEQADAMLARNATTGEFENFLIVFVTDELRKAREAGERRGLAQAEAADPERVLAWMLDQAKQRRARAKGLEGEAEVFEQAVKALREEGEG